MAKNRLITSDIFNDDWFGPLTHFQQILWIGLFAKCADDQGRMLDNVVVIRASIFPYQDIDLEQIEQAIEKFAESERILRYRANGKNLIQLLRWWEHQQQQWACPSKLPPPPDWEDHIRTRENNEYRHSNWKGKAGNADAHRGYIIQVNSSGERMERVQVGGHIPVPVPVPDPVKERARKFPDAQDLVEPPQQAATPPEPTARRQKAKPAKEPPPPAVQVYFAVMGKYPPKPLWPRIEADVGDKRELWSQVINGWLGMGWNGGNVNGMLDFLKRGEVPGTKGKNDASTRRHDTVAGWAKRDGLTQADLDRILAERAAESGQ